MALGKVCSIQGDERLTDAVGFQCLDSCKGPAASGDALIPDRCDKIVLAGVIA